MACSWKTGSKLSRYLYENISITKLFLRYDVLWVHAGKRQEAVLTLSRGRLQIENSFRRLVTQDLALTEFLWEALPWVYPDVPCWWPDSRSTSQESEWCSGRRPFPSSGKTHSRQTSSKPSPHPDLDLSVWEQWNVLPRLSDNVPSDSSRYRQWPRAMMYSLPALSHSTLMFCSPFLGVM